MPKLGSAVAAASMSPFPIPGFYTLEIKQVTWKVKEETGSGGFEFQFKTISSDDHPEAQSRTFFKYINITKQDGNLNEMGAGDVRKIVAAAVSLEASADEDFEMDELTGKTFGAQINVKTKEGQEEVTLSKHTAV